MSLDPFEMYEWRKAKEDFMLFSSSKQSDQVMVVEEENRPVIALTQQEFRRRLEDGKLADGTLVTQMTVIEKFQVITRKELEKINGDKHE